MTAGTAEPPTHAPVLAGVSHSANGKIDDDAMVVNAGKEQKSLVSSSAEGISDCSSTSCSTAESSEFLYDEENYRDLYFDPRIYDISVERGFLPLLDPLQQLPGEFAIWQDVLKEASRRLQSGVAITPALGEEIRALIDQIPLLTSEELKSLPERRLAATVMAMLTMVYVWCGGEDAAPSSLPRNISIPLLALTESLHLPPIITHATVSLYNFRLLNPAEIPTIENLEAINIMIGGKDESAFLMIPIEIEFYGIPAVRAFLRAQRAVLDNRRDVILSSLQEIGECLQKMTMAMKKMAIHCDPQTFYRKIRPFFAGWNQCRALPNGLLYERDGDAEPLALKLDGGSGGQSALIQLFDVGLGVKHGCKTPQEIDAEDLEENEKPAERGGRADTSAMLRLRTYMPDNHQEFLRAVETGPSIRRYIVDAAHHNKKALERKDDEVSDETCIDALIDAYNACVKQFITYRSQHLNIAALFIVNQARKLREEEALKNASSTTLILSSYASSAAAPTLEAVGTSGSNIIKFLAGVRADTKDVLLEEEDESK